jgi:hypothetical protein
MTPQQELQRKRGKANTGQPVHFSPPSLSEENALLGESLAEHGFQFNKRHTPDFIRTVVKKPVASSPSTGWFLFSLPGVILTSS